MIAIDVGAFGHFVAGHLTQSLGVVPSEMVTLSESEIDSRGSDALVVLGPDRARLERVLTPEIRWVHVLSTGVDGFPFDLMDGRVLTCSRGASAIAISEFVLAAMLDFEKHLPTLWISGPEQWHETGLGQLHGRRVGLIGIGAIGSAVAIRALAFGMDVVAYRRTPTPSPMEGVALVTSLEDLLPHVDHLVVAAPATPDTHHLLNSLTFGALKPGTHLINVSRGSLIDHDALLDALDHGQVSVATLDVTEPEPLPAGHPLYAHARVRISPHVSWNSPETARCSVGLFTDNVRRHLAGERLDGVVDLASGY
jgi:phosphoglycerate dehydrogenase-like enzyme